MDDVVENKTLIPSAERAEVPKPPFEFQGATAASLKHPDRNEDTMGYGRDATGGWAAVFDGVGGLPGGEQASKVALEVVRGMISKISTNDLPQVEQQMIEIMKEANRVVGETVPGSATTATIAKFIEKNGQKFIVAASVGDSRPYLYRQYDQGADIVRIMPEDSAMPDEKSVDLEEVKKQSDLTGDDEFFFNRRRLISQSVGGTEDLMVHTARFMLRNGSKIIFTTDGIHDNLTRDEILEAMETGSDEADALVRKSRLRSMQERTNDNIRPKKDDMTAVVVGVN